MKKFLLLLFFASFFILQACQDSGTDDILMQYVETQCDNPWEALPGPENYLVEVRKYLEDEGINVISLYTEVYDENPDANCSACNCLTGRNIVVGLAVEHSKQAEAIGFTFRE